MKIALVHDHLTQEGGAERVLKAFHDMYPDAPIYTLVYDDNKLGKFFDKKRIRPSFLQKFPFVTKHYQWLLPLMPTATEIYDLSAFDIVLSSSSAFSKGVITRSTTLHICYCHTPTRYLWMDTHRYIKELRQGKMVKPFIPFLLTALRIWDQAAADRVDKFVGNSKTVQERIKKYYKRDSDIIYPPVNVSEYSIVETIGDYYLAGGRLVAYKRFDIVVEAFNRLGLKIKIFGEGPEYKKLSKNAKQCVEFVGKVSDEEKIDLYRHCIAYIHPQEEDFGISLVQAAAAGRPAIALAAGGALESMIDGVTGTFFYDQDWAALANTILHFQHKNFDPHTIRQHALKFSADRFKKEMSAYVETSWHHWQEMQHIRRLREMKLMF
ncbi:MAG: glycosyltransferase [bacterium]|nr:glycosyltransferase [bacterium]